MIKLLLSIIYITLILSAIANAEIVKCDDFTNSIVKSKCFLNKGVSLQSLKKYQVAAEQYRYGIKSIGADYNTNMKFIDDTGMKLTLANIEFEKGNFKVSMNLYSGVLTSRITMAEDSAKL